MKQALVRLPNERPECNDIKLGDCLRLLHTHRGPTIVRDLAVLQESLYTAVNNVRLQMLRNRLVEVGYGLDISCATSESSVDVLYMDHKVKKS